MANGRPAILAEGLENSYGESHALRTLDLEVEEGTVLGLLGPNGAGKTTAVRILTTLLKPDAGRAEDAGFDGYMAMECAIRGDAKTVLPQVVRHLRSLTGEEGGTP